MPNATISNHVTLWFACFTLNPFMPHFFFFFFFFTKSVLSDWFLCQMSIPGSDCDIRLVIFDFEYKMFASLFSDGGIKWVGVFLIPSHDENSVFFLCISSFSVLQ